jgi:gliding motility-associated-like protein/uncharacterized repeat protein (TIGR01451 family)
VTWTVTDVNGLVSSAIQKVTIVDRPMVVTDKEITTLMNTPITTELLNNASDPDGTNNFQLSNVTQPSHGRITIGADNKVTYTPTNGFFGTDIAYFTICNNDIPECKTGKLTINVIDNNIDLTIKKSTFAGSVNLNEEFDYTIVVSNTGHVTANDVIVSDPLPASIEFVSSQNTLAIYDPNSRTVNWNIKSLGVNEEVTLSFKVKGIRGGIVTNRAEIIGTQPDLDPSNNSSQVDKTILGFIIPNVFSPNGDGANDNFEINGLTGLESQIVIVSRWGNEVYKNYNYKNDWDGSQLSEGTYFYVLTVKAADAKSVKYSGYITIVR